jgi:FtsP/CotA-like multicopper oxidase with cupredoxin domain
MGSWAKHLFLAAATAVVFAGVCVLAIGAGSGHAGRGLTRTFYIAADEVQWNYAPSGRNLITNRDFGDAENTFVKRGPHRIGSTYVKSLYREYTSASFTSLKPRLPEWAHLGFLGPVIHAEVGDTIRFVFKNNTRHRLSVHPHGVFYDKDSEGAPYNDGTRGAEKADDAVPPRKVHEYV